MLATGRATVATLAAVDGAILICAACGCAFPEGLKGSHRDEEENDVCPGCWVPGQVGYGLDAPWDTPK
ncbi:MAG TPA: hypothetical protein VMB71_09655 [Acetobacteraceae bacterium]|nr:hypothetical protein [Acetobacteraceae bacterium]